MRIEFTINYLRYKSTEMAISSTPPIDRKRLQSIADTPEEEREILDLFFSHAETKTTGLLSLWRIEQKKEWQSATHYLKGSAANLGMTRLVEICQKAEQGGALSRENAEAIVQQIRQALQDIRDYLGSE